MAGMAVIRVAHDRFELDVSKDELTTLKNCMNEALDSLGDDFAIRVGATREEVIELVELLIAELSSPKESESSDE